MHTYTTQYIMNTDKFSYKENIIENFLKMCQTNYT